MDADSLLQGMIDNDVQAYYKYMVDVAIIFGADKERAEEELLDVLEFETNLANVRSILFVSSN